MVDFVHNVWIIPCLPLLGAIIAAVGARRLGSNAHFPVVAGIALAFLVSLGAFFSAGPETTVLVPGGSRSATSTSPSSSGSTA